MYVVMDIGCMECKEPSRLLGIFIHKEDAQALCDLWETSGWTGERWCQQHVYMVLDCPVLNRALDKPSEEVIDEP